MSRTPTEDQCRNHLLSNLARPAFHWLLSDVFDLRECARQEGPKLEFKPEAASAAGARVVASGRQALPFMTRSAVRPLATRQRCRPLKSGHLLATVVATRAWNGWRGLSRRVNARRGSFVIRRRSVRWGSWAQPFMWSISQNRAMESHSRKAPP